eukprot:SAG11_NODE_34984_length_269_cov_0.594118_2_plen_23_part_01
MQSAVVPFTGAVDASHEFGLDVA